MTNANTNLETGDDTVIRVAQRLVELTRADQDAQALTELYADDVVSVEASTPEGEPQTWEGIQAVLEKHEWWNSMATMHEIRADGPYAGMGADQFAVKFWMDVTLTDQGRSQQSEIGIFTVANGKIVHEVYLPLTE